MTTSLFTGVCSIVPTKRRRFFWAAWWTAPPEAQPFRKPDGASGGARSREEARRAAERAAGRSLVEIDGRWAGAWVRVLRGQPPFPKPREGSAEPSAAPSMTPPREGSATWALSLLGVAKGATEEEIKRAFRALALRTHPDRGGDEAAFIDAKRALDVALAKGGERRRKRR